MVNRPLKFYNYLNKVNGNRRLDTRLFLKQNRI